MDGYQMSIEINADSLLFERSGDETREGPNLGQSRRSAVALEGYPHLLRKVARVIDEKEQWQRASVVANYLVPSFSDFSDTSDSAATSLRCLVKVFHNQVQRCNQRRNDVVGDEDVSKDAELEQLVRIAKNLVALLVTTFDSLPDIEETSDDVIGRHYLELQFLAGFLETLRPFTQVSSVEGLPAITARVDRGSKQATPTDEPGKDTSNKQQYTNKRDFLAYVHKMIDTMNPIPQPSVWSDFMGAAMNDSSLSQSTNQIRGNFSDETLDRSQCCNDQKCFTSVVDAKVMYEECFPARAETQRLFELSRNGCVRPSLLDTPETGTQTWMANYNADQKQNISSVDFDSNPKNKTQTENRGTSEVNPGFRTEKDEDGQCDLDNIMAQLVNNLWAFDFDTPDTSDQEMGWGGSSGKNPIKISNENAMLSDKSLKEFDVHSSIYNAYDLRQEYNRMAVVSEHYGTNVKQTGYSYGSFPDANKADTRDPAGPIRYRQHTTEHPYGAIRRNLNLTAKTVYEAEVMRDTRFNKFLHDLSSDRLCAFVWDWEESNKKGTINKNGGKQNENFEEECNNHRKKLKTVKEAEQIPNETFERNNNSATETCDSPHKKPKIAEKAEAIPSSHWHEMFAAMTLNPKQTQKVVHRVVAKRKCSPTAEESVKIVSSKNGSPSCPQSVKPKPFKTGFFCSFCKQMDRSALVYLSHNRNDLVTKIALCPFLRAHVCRFCNKTGDEAHTIEDCKMY